MANWSVLKAAVANIINTNGNQAITGQLLQNVLNNIITNVGENSTFAGIATVDTNPGAPDGPVFYLATTAGIYPNFNSLEVLEGEAIIFEWDNGTWSKKTTGFATQEKLTNLQEETDEKLSQLASEVRWTTSDELNKFIVRFYIENKENAIKDGLALTNIDYEYGAIYLGTKNGSSLLMPNLQSLGETMFSSLKSDRFGKIYIEVLNGDGVQHKVENMPNISEKSFDRRVYEEVLDKDYIKSNENRINELRFDVKLGNTNYISKETALLDLIKCSVSTGVAISEVGSPILSSTHKTEFYDVSNYELIYVKSTSDDGLYMFMTERSWVENNTNLIGHVMQKPIDGFIKKPTEAKFIFISSSSDNNTTFVGGVVEPSVISSINDRIEKVSGYVYDSNIAVLSKNQKISHVEFQPYAYSVELTVCSTKNILNIDKSYIESQSTETLSVTYDENLGCIILNGKVSSYKNIGLFNMNYWMPKGSYVLSSNVLNSVVNLIFANIGIKSNQYSRTIELTDDTKITNSNTFIQLLPNVEYNNVELYVQLEQGGGYTSFIANRNSRVHLPESEYTRRLYMSGMCVENGVFRNLTSEERGLADLIGSGFCSSIFVNDSGIGRIKYSYKHIDERKEQIKSVKDYGAVGDGITDDSDALNIAFQSGGCIYVPKGTYVISKTIYISGDTTIFGDGFESKIKLADIYSLDAIQRDDEASDFIEKLYYPYLKNIDGATNIHIEKIMVEGSTADIAYTPNQHCGISLHKAKNCSIRNVYVNRICYHPNLVDRNTAGQKASRGFNIAVMDSECIVIEDCIAEYGGYECCRIGHNAKNVSIRNCRFNYGWRTCLQIIWGCENINVENCSIEQDDFDICDTHAFLTIHTLPNSWAKDITISNCRMRGKLWSNGTDLGCISCVDGYNENVTIKNCHIELLGDGYSFYLPTIDLNGHNFKIIGNTIDTKGRGICHTITTKKNSITILHNKITSEGMGIALQSPYGYDTAKIHSNIIKSSNNVDGDGMYIYTPDTKDIDSLSIDDNNVISKRYGVNCSSLNVKNSIITRNVIDSTKEAIKCPNIVRSVVAFNNAITNKTIDVPSDTNTVQGNIL